jgi:GDP-L-fucose synthase
MSKLLITGASGLVGSALQQLTDDNNTVYVSSQKYDLTKDYEVESMFLEHKPNNIIHLAGMVGGVGINMKKPVEFFENNLLMNTLIMKYAHQFKVSRVVSFMSTCVFPDTVEYPLQPSKIHLGEPHSSNFGYAYAKRMVEVQTRAYQQEYNKPWFNIIPTNIYGPNDNYNLESSHVIPALIHKCFLAKKTNNPWIIWGSGKAVREFVHSQDVANITLQLLDKYWGTEPVIVSTQEQHSIEEVVELIAKAMDFKGYIVFDKTKPEGQYRKPSDTTPLQSILPDYKFIPLETGIIDAAAWFEKNYDIARK